jgi:hypothetical protein
VAASGGIGGEPKLVARINLAAPSNAPRRCNCAVWALNRLWRRGGYIAFRRSRHSRFVPHMMWSRDARRWWNYTPIRPRLGIAVMFHALWFRGRVGLGE